MVRTHIFLFAWLIQSILLFNGQALAGGTASAMLDKTSGTLEDQFTVSLTITGDVKTEIKPPVIDGCESYQAGVSRNMQWINGAFSSEVQYNFVIQPNREGTFTVPSWNLEIDGTKVSTLPLKFTVTGGSGKSDGANNQPVPEIDDRDVFVEREAPTRPIYVGEVFVSVIRIYHRVKLTALSPKRVSAPEFRVLQVPGDKTYQRVINGVRYQVIELKEALIPLRSGAHKLPPFTAQASVLRSQGKMPGGSVFDLFSNPLFGSGGLSNFFGREENIDLSGKETLIKVLDLPLDGRPANFSGLVGDFNLASAPFDRQVKSGESISVKLSVSGRGALDTLAEVPNDLRDVGKVYPDKPELKEEFVAAADGSLQLQSQKSFSMAVVPTLQNSSDTAAQDVDLGKARLSWFNPTVGKHGKYEASEIDLGRVTIVTSPTEASATLAKTEIESRESRPVETSGTSDRSKLPVGLVTLIIATAIAGLAASFWRRKTAGTKARTKAAEGRNTAAEQLTDADEFDDALSQTFDAAADRQGSLSQNHIDVATWVVRAEQHVQAGYCSEALVAIEKAARGIVAGKIGRSVDAMTVKELQGIAIDNAELASVIDLLQEVEVLMFSGREVSVESTKLILERLKRHA